MDILHSLSLPKPNALSIPRRLHLLTPALNPKPPQSETISIKTSIKKPTITHSQPCSKATAILIGAAGITLISLAVAGPSSAVELPNFSEPSNALSLPTWAVHVSSVVEWATAMALVWQYGEKSGFESWKGLSWGMVPLLGGALCACTWHFFYNSESLEVLVALQAALTVIGNATMCLAAYRIYMSAQERSNDS